MCCPQHKACLSPFQGSSNSSSFQTLRQDLQRTQRRGGNPDQALQTAFGTIRKISDGLRLNQRIQDRAAEVFKQVGQSSWP